MLAKALITVAFVALLVFVLLPRLERRMVFFPTRAWDVDPGLAAPAEPVRFFSQDGIELSGLWMPAEAPRGVLVYAHGNAGNLSHRIPTAMAWREHLKVSILLFDYRGYGRSQGSPSEEGIFLDTLAAFHEAQRLGQLAPILLGRSLGTVPVIRVAAQEEARGLILDSPLASAAAMARRVLPLPGIGYLATFRLDNLTQIEKVTCPLLVMHGEFDEVVPLEQGRQVYEAAPDPKTFILLKGMGHNDDRMSPELMQQVAAFLEGLK